MKKEVNNEIILAYKNFCKENGLQENFLKNTNKFYMYLLENLFDEKYRKLTKYRIDELQKNLEEYILSLDEEKLKQNTLDKKISRNNLSRFEERVLRKFYHYIQVNSIEINNETINKYILEKYSEFTSAYRKRASNILFRLKNCNIRTADDLLVYIKSNKLKIENFKLIASVEEIYKKYCIQQKIRHFDTTSLEQFVDEVESILKEMPEIGDIDGE